MPTLSRNSAAYVQPHYIRQMIGESTITLIDREGLVRPPARPSGWIPSQKIHAGEGVSISTASLGVF
jgi:hypothetical protein